MNEFTIIHILTTIVIIFALCVSGYYIYNELTPEEIIKEGFVVDTEYSEGAFGHTGLTVVYFQDNTTLVIHDVVEVPRNKNVRITLMRTDVRDKDIKVEVN